MSPRDDDGQVFAGIDPALMRAMIRDLEGAKNLIDTRVPGLKSAFAEVGLSVDPVTALMGVGAWVVGELPMLNRRQAMAEQLLKENAEYGFTSPMVQTEWPGLFASKAEAEAKVKELAGKYEKPGGFPDDVWDQIIKYQSDPDFAEAFLKALGPKETAWVAARLRTWDEPKHDERLRAFATLMGVASHRGLFDDEWLKKFTTDNIEGPDLHTLAAVIQHGVWDTRTLVDLGNRALRGGQLGGGNILTARILDGLSRNPLAAHQVYSENFDLINAMAYGKQTGWINTTNPDLGDPLGTFMKAATVDAAEIFERTRPPGDQTWVNPADTLAMRLFQTVGQHPDQRFPFAGVENAFIDIVQRFFTGTYSENLLPEGGLTWYDTVQLCADLAGIFDPTPISDGVSALMSLGQGDWKGALLSAAAMIPYFGDAASKPIKTFLELIRAFPALKIFFKVPEDAIGDASKLGRYLEAITKGFDELKNTVKIVLKNNPTKLLEALGVVNRLHTDAGKIYAKYPRWADKAKKLNLPTDGPIPFVPPKNWNVKNPQKDVLNGREGFVDDYGNVWHKGPGRGGQDYEWDVQVKGRGGLTTLTGDGSHLNVEWGTGRGHARMSRRVNVTMIARADGPAEIAALFDRFLDDIGTPAADRGEPERYDKFPGCWLNAAVLEDVPGDDATEVVTRLTARTDLTGWTVTGDADLADGVWNERKGAAEPYPELSWLLIEARPPAGADDPAETEELVPLMPEGMTDAELARIAESLTEETGGGDKKPGEP